MSKRIPSKICSQTYNAPYFVSLDFYLRKVYSVQLDSLRAEVFQPNLKYVHVQCLCSTVSFVTKIRKKMAERSQNNEKLEMFFAIETRNKDGLEYESDSLRVMMASLDR